MMGWLPIETIHQHEINGYFLLTDGEKVTQEFRVEYDRNGMVYMSPYAKTYATHWRHMPMPPMKEGK
jgi:hypothetical protein